MEGVLPPVQTQRGGTVSKDLGLEITEQAKGVGRTYGATPYMVFLAAFYVVLHRYTRREDVIVGSPISGPSSAEFRDLVAYFVNQVALRADLSGNPTFEEFLARIRRLVLKAFEHKDYPFSLLVKHLEPSRQSSRSPVFQAMFVFQQTARPEMKELAAFSLGKGGVKLK